MDDHFMIVVDDCGKKRRLLLGGMSKFKVFIIFIDINDNY